MRKWQGVVKKSFSGFDFRFSYFRGQKRCDNIFCFDVETTSYYIWPDGTVHEYDYDKPISFYEDCIKGGFVYLWMFSIDDTVIYGRFIEDYKNFVTALTEYLDADILVFVHNLAFETQFLRNVFNDDVSIFARKKRRSMKIVDGNVEYRCSYMLTRLSLENWAKSKKLPVQKMVGDLDYNVLRTPYTFMTKKELKYGENDVLVMYYGIKQYEEEFGSVWDIPLTQTGIVRKAYNDLLADEDRLHSRMAKLVPDFELYTLLLEAFWGGIAHASFKWVNELLKGVTSYDKKSSYPWELVSKKYPCTPFVKCCYNDRYLRDDSYSYLITVELYNFTSKLFHTYISSSKCKYLKGEVLDNGRVVHADYAVIVCTNIDYEIILDCYDIEEKEVLDFRLSCNEYLPRKVRLFILEWFCKKTTLDGIVEVDALYRKSKEFINAIFGMMCTREFTDEIVYKDGKWDIEELTQEEFNIKRAKKLRKKRKLNNAFQWGVWCTAYARRSLWDSVTAELYGELINDEVSVYLDTDANKLFAGEKQREWFKRYNEKIYAEQDKIAEDLNISVDMLRPRRPDGEICALGVYKDEGTYDEFKTLGAKKYCYLEDGEVHITVSGVRKAAASQLTCVDDFQSGLTFDLEHAKKVNLVYNDDQEWTVINRGKYDEFACMYPYGVCAQPTTYTLDMKEEFDLLVQDYMELHTQLYDKFDIVAEIVRRADERRKEKERKVLQSRRHRQN